MAMDLRLELPRAKTQQQPVSLPAPLTDSRREAALDFRWMLA